MKTLILCVDRDDDIGSKGQVATPIVGRRRIVEAAVALGIADPEDSDTNSLFAAAHLYDKELRRASEQGSQLEVAAVAGQRTMGLGGDRKLARELDEVLELTRPDEVILVSDGAEDEQIIPLLASRVRVAHVHRTIVRQAPRLEGFYYILTRLIEDKKLARRYVLPVGLVILVWGVAFLMDWAQYAWGITLAIVGGWLVVQAMHWEDRMSRLLRDFREGLRSGKVSVIGNIVALILLIVGAVESYGQVPAVPLQPCDLADLACDPGAGPQDRVLQTFFFAQEYLYYLVGALLLRTAALLFDGWFRTGQASLRHWTTAFTLVAFGFIGSVVLVVAVAVRQKTALQGLVTFDLVVQLLAGLAVAMSGFLLARYVKTFAEEPVT
jgi:putative membrane protein